MLQRALSDKEKGYGLKLINLSSEAANHLVDVSNGDARVLLNALELAVESTIANQDSAGNVYQSNTLVWKTAASGGGSTISWPYGGSIPGGGGYQFITAYLSGYLYGKYERLLPYIFHLCWLSIFFLHFFILNYFLFQSLYISEKINFIIIWLASSSYTLIFIFILQFFYPLKEATRVKVS